MHHQRFALISLSLLVALPGCGRLKVVDVPEPDDEISEAPAPRTRPVAESTGTAWASQLALDACRKDVARRWRVSESSVRTSTRAHDANDGSDLVNWEAAGATGFCRVDRRGTLLNVVTERSPAPQPDVAREPTPAPAPAPARPAPRSVDPDDPDAPVEPPQVAPEQLAACRSAVVRETGARPEDVGLSAGTPDESGTVLVDWSLGTGRQGTCLVDAGNAVVQFLR
jgi:hypothetical protein